MKNAYLYQALISAIGISVAQASVPPPTQDQEKCYGVAEPGDNLCNGYDENGEYHSCPSWQVKPRDPYAWTYVEKGKCLEMGGKFEPPPPPKGAANLQGEPAPAE